MTEVDQIHSHIINGVFLFNVSNRRENNEISLKSGNPYKHKILNHI